MQGTPRGGELNRPANSENAAFAKVPARTPVLGHGPHPHSRENPWSVRGISGDNWAGAVTGITQESEVPEAKQVASKDRCPGRGIATSLQAKLCSRRLSGRGIVARFGVWVLCAYARWGGESR